MLLNNFGNTCYINTVLQLFLNNESFMKHIKSKEYNDEELLNLIKKIVDSSSLRKFLICLQEKLGQTININEQNDASEIYTKLLDLFEKEDESSIEHFNGIHKKLYKCSVCKNKREKKENFTNLNLYITPTTNTLQSSLMKIFEKETLDEVECEICKCNTKTEVKNKIIKWPKNLIFSINRYTADHKINSEFDYTRHIELCIAGKINKYTLTGIINHIGTKELGHYNYVKVSNDTCVEINDDKVKQIVNFKSPTNYILIYNLVN